MRDLVETLIARDRLDDAAVAFRNCASCIATLDRDDWSQWVRTIKAKLQNHLGRGGL